MAALAQAMSVVLIDDDKAHLDLMRHSLESLGPRGVANISVTCFNDVGRALANMPPVGPLVICCDYQLGSDIGLDWIADLTRINLGPVILVTNSSSQEVIAEAFRRGAADYLDKSAFIGNPQTAFNTFRQALRRSRLESNSSDLARSLKLANAELEHKNQTMAEMTRVAHEFVDDVAHEFRTPLAVILEFASIITDGLGGPVTAQQTEFLSFIQSACKNLADLVDDFLDSSKIRAHSLRVDRRPQDLHEILRAAWPLFEARGAAKKIRLTLDCPSDLPFVWADAEKVRRILVNLVVNATKFSNPGDEVAIVVRPDPQAGIRINVVDHGVGLSTEECQHLFTRFQQGVAGVQTAGKGFGLGLSIVSNLVALHFGQINVQSAPGKGSTFSFTLPIDDVNNIVDVFFRDTSQRNPSAVISLLEISCDGPGDRIEDLRQVLSASTYPRDIELPLPDHSSILLIGETTEPSKWADRLLHESQQRSNFASEEESLRLTIQHVGSWSIVEARNHILARLSESLVGSEGHPHA